MKLPTIPKSALWVLVLRLVILVIVLVCSVLIWWSISRRLLPAGRQLHDKAAVMSRLENEVQQLEMNWNIAEAEQTESRFQQAKATLITGPEMLAKWQKDNERRARAQALVLLPPTEARKSRPFPGARQGLGLLLVAMDLRPLETGRATNSPYRCLLEFTRLLQDSGKRFDLTELSANGSSNSLQQARLVLHLWTAENLQP